MPPTSQRRNRGKRVTSFRLPPGFGAQTLETLRRGDVLLRIGLCFLAAVVLWLSTQAWAPPMSYRLGDIPKRDIVARASFQKFNKVETDDLRERARVSVPYVYSHDSQILKELREILKHKVLQIMREEGEDELTESVWQEFWLAPLNATEITTTESVRQEQIEQFRQALIADPGLESFEKAMQRAMEEVERQGILLQLDEHHEERGGNLTQIKIDNQEELLRVDDVLLDRVIIAIKERLDYEFALVLSDAVTREIVVQRVHDWIANRLPEYETLTGNQKATDEAGSHEASKIKEVFDIFPGGHGPDAEGATPYVLALADKPLDKDHIDNLLLEHTAYVKDLKFGEKLDYSLASFGMYLAMYVLCGWYLFFRDREILSSTRRFCATLGLAVAAVILCRIAGRDGWHAEIIPMLLFAMTVGIAFSFEAALLFSAAVALVVVITLGQGLPEFVVFLSSAATAILLLREVRSRTKLLYVCAVAGAVAMLTAIGVGTLDGSLVPWLLMKDAAWIAACSIIAGLLMTGLLPFVEKLFEVQTEISLLELGDAAHPLLQELVRRAPGTYNHSINVASIAEAAAEAVKANGLLVRVGAYFHDIGKMLKPGYFIENQSQEPNRHETLLPAMSTLVIIAHVKDGADLAQQHRLPKTIIDFIQQHHGTTLVEYFYREASRQSEQDPDAGEVDETSFRYPGPKPRTREAGVLMLADAVESASRTLVDPTPARIESLVHDLAMKRLIDGQFDDCGLTLQEVHTIEESLIKSLIAVYHGRVKYPDQESA